jgi:hypothetical protein
MREKLQAVAFFVALFSPVDPDGELESKPEKPDVHPIEIAN